MGVSPDYNCMINQMTKVEIRITVSATLLCTFNLSIKYGSYILYVTWKDFYSRTDMRSYEYEERSTLLLLYKDWWARKNYRQMDTSYWIHVCVQPLKDPKDYEKVI